MDITLLKESHTNDINQAIEYPQNGSPLVSVFRVELAAGESSGWHMHNVPVIAYIQSGSFELQVQHEMSNHFQSGDSMFEPVGVPINVTNKGNEPGVAIVVKVGSTEQTATVYLS